MSRIDTVKRRIASITVACGLVAGAMLFGAGSASATNPEDAPPGYAGPFSYCKGSEFDSIPLSDPDGAAYINVWLDNTGSGTFCAMTMDRRDGRHHMEVRVRRDLWQTSWYDNGYYDRYAGAIYVSGAEIYCAYISGWVELDGVKYSNGEWICK